jgi:hypothetical protein
MRLKRARREVRTYKGAVRIEANHEIKRSDLKETQQRVESGISEEDVSPVGSFGRST